MKILIVSPLFPPDTAASASYTKELSARLAKDHEVNVLLYGHLPEEVPGVKLLKVDKRQPGILRVFSFMRALQYQSWLNDIVLVQNGPSVELPSFFTLQYTKIPMILMESDPSARKRTMGKPTYNMIYKQLLRRADAVFGKEKTWPLSQPIIHPLKPHPTKELGRYETSWENHCKQLQAIMNKLHA